ncbi:MAG TPA: ATP-binding protein [Steroidobacteraceae bacterium]|nr:ATP-binding protein [Steroidobacteraceae bacterium]
MSPPNGRPAAAPRLRGRRTSDLGFLAGGGQMGERMRALDWRTTPLGPPERWPQSLKTIVRVMLDSRYAMWMLWGPELTFFCNDAYLPTVGIKSDWVLGARSDKVWQEIWPDIGPRIAQVLEQGRATWDEALLLFLERSGFREETYHTFSYSPVYDDESRIAGMLCVVTEVTERVVGERRLRILRDLAARAVGVTGVEESCRGACEVLEQHPFSIPFAAIYLLDEESRTARRIAATRGTPEHVLPSTLDAANTPWPLEALLSSEAAQHVAHLPQLGIEVAAGTWPDLVRDAFLLPLKGTGGDRLAGFIVAGASPRRVLDEAYRTFFGLLAGQVAATIADAQAIEAERRRAEALAEIDRAKTIFFSNISHEFRTPLTLMLGPIEDAVADPATPPSVRGQLELAHRNSLRLLKLVNSLLDFSRIEAGRVEASFEATDLAALTRDLASTFRSAMERAGLTFTVECSELGQPVYVDREMWEKIVLNLVSNAFKFTLRGGIVIRLRAQGGCAVLEVSDTGSGIPAAELPRIFERFRRVEGTVGRTQEGSGIGLALVQELVKLHGGMISATSELGIGTTLRVTLPLGSAHLPRERIKAPRTLASTAAGAQAFVQEALRWIPTASGDSFGGLSVLTEQPAPPADRRVARTAGSRILLADDNADMRSYVRELLSPVYTVETVRDGAEALEAARREPPDLLLSDIMMPRIDGLALLRSLRADERLREVPVILLSARAGEESRLEGLDAGADDYLVKPFSARELLARVGALLELAQMRRGSEQAVREREEQLRLATEAAEIGFWDVDLITDTLVWPPRVKAMFGISADVPVSMADFYAGLHPADRERTSEAFAAALDPNQRALYDVEYRTVGKEDGLIRWVAAKGRGIFDGDGRCVRVIGTAIDITRRKRAEERLREETRVQELLGRVSHALVGAQLDKQRVVQVVTDAATELTGAAFGAFFYNVQNEQGERYTLYTLSGAPREAFPFPQPRNTRVFGPTFRGEAAVRSADITADPRYGQNPPYRGMPPGHPPVRSYLAVPVKSASGEVLGGLFFGHPEPGVFDERSERLVQAIAAQAAVALDNATLHEASQREIAQRKRVQEALDEANRRKDEFLAMLAHELRNPLSPIGTASELLARTVVGDKLAQTAIGMIKRQVAQLTRLVDDLLDVSRITQGRIQLQRRPIDIAAVIAQGVETLEPQLREKRHQLSLHASSYEPLYVMGDFARLVQCIGNILTNAVKYTEPGGRISIRTGIDAERLFIEISDSGPGISAELLPRVFDLFVQSERTLDRSQGGLGIGLAVVKRLVEMHDGEVCARSEGLGRGSTFEIRLPRIARPAAGGADAAALKAEPRRVLIVDDNADAANSLSMLLALQGHATQVAYGAKEALACIDNFRPEIGLIDIGLPEIDGYELAARLREKPNMDGLRLVAVTGYGQAEDQQRALAAGFDAHLVKPVDLSALERALAGMPVESLRAREDPYPRGV